MAFEAHITTNIEEIGKVAWDALSAGSPFQSYNWYRFGEKVMSNARPIYVVLSENDQAIARASFWHIDREYSIAGLTAALLKRWPLLVCRSPLSSTAGWILPNPGDGAIKEIVKIGQQLRRQEKCSFLVFDSLDAATARAVPRALRYSFGELSNRVDTRGILNFDQYLARLTSKERKDIRRDFRRIKERGITVTRHPTVPDLDEAESLYRKLEVRKGSARDPYVRSMLENISMVNGTWLAARDTSGQLIGCLSLYEDNGAQYVIHMARDVVEYVYMALVYESIHVGLEHGLHTFYWGSESYSFKKRLGGTTFENDSIAVVF